MVSQISTILSDAKININSVLNKSKGDYAYTMVDIPTASDSTIVSKIEAIDGVIRVRIID